MSKLYLKCCSFSLVMLLSITTLFAQQTVTGIVTDKNGALAGVTVSVVGTSIGTQTDGTGAYSVRANNGQNLRFSNIGYTSKDIQVSGTKINVTLVEDAGSLEEVVVTAMGIKREKKSLGYAFQDVKSETLVNARENNLANALTGKVSGLQVIKGTNGPASSSKIVLRGFNSLTGDNQPLIVVDGVPMENFAGAKNNDFWNPSADMGNGLGDLNPEDIASMSVLKGGAASALYGSRAGNGVILITTKTGKSQEGAGITYSATIGLENIFMKPKIQKIFSQGSNSKYDARSGVSWGEKISGQTVTDWNDKPLKLTTNDNLKNFFKTGVNTTHNLAFQQAINENTNIYTSATYLHDNSKTPGVKLDRLNLMSKVTSNFGPNKRWTTDVKVQYMNTTAKNRPVGGANAGNYYSTALTMPTTMDITQFKPGMDELGVKQTWYNPNGGLNPYWAAANKLNSDTRDRFLLNATVKYEFNDWLNADFRAGSDIYSTKYDNRTFRGSSLPNSYGTQSDNFYENNFIVSLNARKDNLFGKWSGSASVFGQIMKQDFKSLKASASELEVPNLFTIQNAVGNPRIEEDYRKKQINSLFATAEMNYDNYWFINATVRNDWSSTLSKQNRSFFYPSISTSFVITDMINKTGGTNPFWLNFAKVRASYAEAGNSLEPYQLMNTYAIEKDPNGNSVAKMNRILFDPNIKSELLKTFEAGFDMRLFERFNIDFSYYKSNAINQSLAIPLNHMSAYESEMINTGNIQNEGVEIVIAANILNNPEKLRWDLNINFSRNINKILELTDKVPNYRLGGYDNLNIYGEKNQRYGAIYGTKFARVEEKESPYYGQRILNTNGLPTSNRESYYLGNQSATALLGITNSFAYKNFGLSFLVDARFGGKFFSGTQHTLQSNGLATATVVNGERADFVVEGVIGNSKDGYTQNTKSVTHQQYWGQVTGIGNLGISEQNIYNATNIRLRNIQLSYSIPKKVLGSSVVKNARVSVSANNVWMIKSYANGVDPESVYAIGTNAVGFEHQSFPTSRSYFFNISLGF